MDSRSLSIRAPISDDVDDSDSGEMEDENMHGEDDGGSFVSDESFDSALDAMALASNADAPSSAGSSNEPVVEGLAIEDVGSPQQGALRQLNELNSGVSSLDTSLLDNSSEEEFRKRVSKIAESKNLSSDAEVIRIIVDALLPIVRERLAQTSFTGDSLPRNPNSWAMPVAKPSVEDDDDSEALNEEDAFDVQRHAEGYGDSDQAEEDLQGDGVQPDSARGFRVRGADTDDVMPETARGLRVRGVDHSFEESEDHVVDTNGRLPIQPEPSYEAPMVPASEDLSDGSESVPLANDSIPEKSNGDAVREFFGGTLPANGLDETEANSSPDATDRQPQEIENLEQADHSGVDAASLKQETVSVSDQPVDFESLGSVDASLQSLLETSSPNPVAKDTAPMKSKVEEISIPVEPTGIMGEGKETESSEISTRVEPTEVMGEGKETESSEGSPDVKEEPKLVPKEERSVVEDMVVNRKGSEETKDDNVKEREVPVNAARTTGFVNSKATTAPTTDTPSLGGAGPSLPVRPAGLGRSVPSLEHAPRATQRSIGASPPSASRTRENNPSNSDVSEDGREAREKLQMIRVKFLRLAHRLGQSAHNVVVAQVLYRLGLAEQLRGGRGISTAGAFSFERASLLAEEQEAAGEDDLDFGCTIMVLGKSGVGKSATINSLFDEVKSGTDAYDPATKSVREITGTIHGIKLTVIDTPGLLPSFADQRHNEKVMRSVKRFINKSPPDIVLYFDRLDMQSRDYGDLPLLRTITETFGAAVWFNAIVVLTHASSAPPDGANGVPLSYEMFVAQRSHVVQQTIRQAAGDMRLMNPVSLVENHVACRTNRAGQRVLPNGQVWKPQLLLLCFSSKILAEANTLLKLQDSSQGKPFGIRPRVPPLPFLLSSLLQSRAQLRHPDDQLGDDDLYDEYSEDEGDSDSEEEYDDLPPFRRLTREELRLLDDEQRKTYFDELDYRERLFMRQQWKEERIRRREIRKRKAGVPGEVSQTPDEEESAGSAAVPVPMPDMALPPSFDSDCPSHRYRYLDTATQWLVRPVLETHGWDHDSGYDGLNIEKVFVISRKIPASVSGQITKDKKEANLQMECAASFKNGENKMTLAGLDIQTIGKDLAYTLRSETRFSNFKRNKTTCGLAVTILGDTVAAGMKLEDALMMGRQFKLVLNGGAITGRGDVAYGGSLEATLRGKDYPIVHSLSTLGLSIMDWHGDLAIGGNVQAQFLLGKTMMIARANLNNRGAGQISIRASSSEQLQMALIGLIPLLRTVLGNRILNSSG